MNLSDSVLETKRNFKSNFDLNLTSYLRNLPSEYLTTTPWISRKDLRRTNSSASIVLSSSSNNKSHPSSRKTLVPYTSSLSSHSSPSTNFETKSDTDYLRRASRTPLSSINATEGSEVDGDTDQIILSICWYRERIGAAFLSVSTRQAFIVEDEAESAPDFWVLRTLFREVSPKILVLGGKQDARFFKVVQELRGLKEKGSLCGKPVSTSSNSESKISSEGSIKKEFCGESSSSSPRNEERTFPNSQSSVLSSGTVTSPVVLIIRPASEFKYESCCNRILLYPWPGLSRESSNLEKESWVRGKLDLGAVVSVRALGGLMKFLESKGNEILSQSSLLGGTCILGLHSYHMEDLVHVDEATLSFLQIFSEDLHPATSKSGKVSASKEGLSLYALLSRTASSLSSHVLRRVMLRPVRNIELLESRYNFIDWALKPCNFDTIRQLQSCLKNLGNVQLLFYKLQKGHLSVKDWKCLYESLTNLIIIIEVCSAQDISIDAFKQMKDGKNEELFHIAYIIQRTLDFDQANREGRFVVKPGLDHDLDDLKRKFSGLEGIMNKVAEMELINLPSELQDCCVAYLAHIGFLLMLPTSDELAAYLVLSTTFDGNSTTETENYNIPGLNYIFSTTDKILFKTDLCYELDSEFGDLLVEIANRESSIMMSLIEDILFQSQTVIDLVSKAIYIDVMLSFSSVSRELGWIRPNLNNTGDYKVKESRHPLYEVCNPIFVSNDIDGSLKKFPVSVITGPNSSGKTAYMKQIGVIAYLAHLGCFVPAETMSFCPMDAIFSVAMVIPSVTSGFSTFMFDLNRLTVAVRGSTSKSLVLIDEFGSSTYQFDGASLLVSTIDFWTSQVDAPSPQNLNETTLLSGNEFKKALVTHQPLTEDIILRGCPLVFASTHFYKLHDFLQNPNNVRKLCMDTHQEGDKVIPLYQVIEGTSKKSYALQVAQAAGLSAAVIERARQVHTILTPSSVPSRWSFIHNSDEAQKCFEIVKEFLSYDLNSAPLCDLVSGIRKHVNETINTSFSDTIESLQTHVINRKSNNNLIESCLEESLFDSENLSEKVHESNLPTLKENSTPALNSEFEIQNKSLIAAENRSNSRLLQSIIEMYSNENSQSRHPQHSQPFEVSDISTLIYDANGESQKNETLIEE